jgi:hypothetical protein
MVSDTIFAVHPDEMRKWCLTPFIFFPRNKQMSGHGVHVHGAHDHAVEHEAHKGGLGQQVAIFSAVLATAGAVVSFLGGHTQNEALIYKNDAVLQKTQASNQWNYYQARA